MASGLDTAVNAIKQVYGKGITTQQNLKHRAVDEIAKSAQKFNNGGAGFFGSVRDSGNESGGAINEKEGFRTADDESYLQYKVTPKVLAAPIQFSGLLSQAADSDEEAFANLVVDLVETTRERLLKDYNRQFYGLGTGLLASPTAAVVSNVTSFTVDSAQYLRKNMVVDIFNGATKTVDSYRILDIDKQANVIYFTNSIGAALNATSNIIKENIRDSSPAADGKECMGLRGIVDDATDLTTFENISAASNRIWRATNIAASSANLTSDLLQRLMDDVKILGGEMPDTLITHQKQRRRYLDLVVPQKRFQDGNMDAGFQKLEFNGIELWLDEDCQSNVVYALTKKMIEKYEVMPMKMGNYDGSDNFLRLAGFDVYEAYWVMYTNFGTEKRNAHGKISGLGTPSGIA